MTKTKKKKKWVDENEYVHVRVHVSLMKKVDEIIANRKKRTPWAPQQSRTSVVNELLDWALDDRHDVEEDNEE